MGVFDQFKAALGELGDRAGQIVSAGGDRFGGTIEALDAASPRLREIGCNIAEIRLTLGISPAVSLRVIRERAVDDRAFEAFLHRNADSPVLCTIARLVRQSAALQDRVRLEHRSCDELEIELGVPPVVHLVYSERARTSLGQRLAFLFTGRPPRSRRFGRRR